MSVWVYLFGGGGAEESKDKEYHPCNIRLVIEVGIGDYRSRCIGKLWMGWLGVNGGVDEGTGRESQPCRMWLVIGAGIVYGVCL